MLDVISKEFKNNKISSKAIFSKCFKFRYSITNKFTQSLTWRSPEQAEYCGITLTELVEKLISKAKFEKV